MAVPPVVLAKVPPRRWRALWLILPPVLFVAGAFLYPMGRVLVEAFAPGALDYAMHPYVRRVFSIAVRQAAWSTLLTMALALPLAWLFHSRRIPGSRFQLAAHAAPFVMPVFVIVYGLQGVFGARGWLGTTTGIDFLGLLGPFGAVVVAHAYYNYGFAARLLEASLQRRPRDLEAVARTLGASPMGAFLRTTLPLLLPSALAVALLAFLFTFGSFGVVLFMGSGQVHTLETAMHAEVNVYNPNLRNASVLGVMELAVNGILLVGYLALRSRHVRLPLQPNQFQPRAKWTTVAFAWLLMLLAALPILTVLLQGFRLQGSWSLEPWRHLLQDRPMGLDLGRALGLSFLYAATSTVVAVALTAALAYGGRRLPALRRPLEGLASLPVAGSGILLAVAFLAAFGIGGIINLDGTLWIVLVAHTVLAFPFVVRFMLPAFEAHDTRLDEAARLLGARPASVVGRIHWPILRPALLASAGLAAALSLGDFGASSLLMDHSTRGLSVWIPIVDGPFNPLLRARAVALAGLLCALTLVAYLFVERLGAGPRRKPKEAP